MIVDLEASCSCSLYLPGMWLGTLKCFLCITCFILPTPPKPELGAIIQRICSEEELGAPGG